MTKDSSPEDSLRAYHLHSCHSRQAWRGGQTEPYPCDCGLDEAALAHSLQERKTLANNIFADISLAIDVNEVDLRKLRIQTLEELEKGKL